MKSTLKRTVTSPKATALWLINNTSLTFRQIADFCSLHQMEVKSIADGVMSASLKEKNPILHKEVTEEQIHECEQDESKSLDVLGFGLDGITNIKVKKKAYVSISKRHNKPSAILWLHKNITNITIQDIRTITSATKQMIESVINGTYRYSKEIAPKDPVSLGLCTQSQLNALIEKTKERSS
jgi:hypothetical protein